MNHTITARSIARRSISRFKAVIDRTGLSRATICRRVRAGTFPAPVDLGGGLLGFFDDEIDQLLEGLQRVTPRHGASKDESTAEAAAQ